MRIRTVASLVVSVVLAGVMLPRPAGAAGAPQRRIVFSVHQDITTRKVVRQETDISQAFNGTAATNRGGMGGGVAKGIESNVVDESVAVEVVDVSPEGILGCDVTVTLQGRPATPKTRVWIGADGAVRWTDSAHVGDPSLTFLLSLLATHLVPRDATEGTTWNRGDEKFRLDVVADDVAKLSLDGRFGTPPSHGGTETASIDYKPGLFVPTHADLEIRGRDETPTQSAEYHRHVTYALVSDSKAPVR
jgi:hypothetical protein